MKVLCALVLCAVWSAVVCAVGEDAQPPLPSYSYGVTGEPSKIDTAFGNMGEVGPRYEVPSKNASNAEVPTMISSPIQTISEGNIRNETASGGSEEPQVTNEGSMNPPTQSFNTNTSTQALSTTTEKSIVPTKTTNETAPAASDSETTTPIEMSTTTGLMNEPSTSTTAIPGGQSVSPSQTFETGKPTRKPIAGPATIGNATKPGQQNGTQTVQPNSSIVLRPLTIIYYLCSVLLLISTTMY